MKAIAVDREIFKMTEGKREKEKQLMKEQAERIKEELRAKREADLNKK